MTDPSSSGGGPPDLTAASAPGAPSAPSELTRLVQAAAAGDETAWCALTDRFSRLVWSVARSFRLSPDDAADAVQNTWLRLLENLDRIEQPDALPGWLMTTTRHEALGVLRRGSRVVVARGADLGADRADPLADELDAGLLDTEQDVALWRCFRLLSQRCQQLLRLLMVADRPGYAEIAATVGMPVGSIGPTRMRCLAHLRTLVADSGYPFAPGALT